MKKVCIFCLVLLLVFSFPVHATDGTYDISVAEGSNTLDAQRPFLGVQQLVSNTASAILYEINTDTLMYAHNADQAVSPASLVKIMTALIAIEKGSMTDVVTVREEVLNTLSPDAFMVELIVDEVLTVKDLLYCMMVGSGNDAAVVLADHVMGSQQAFVDEMNRYATELGCTGTHFVNVHGLHNNNQYTTARDAGKILLKALENETFREVFCAKYYTVPQTNRADPRKLSTQNYLINNDSNINYFDDRAIGGRTAIANDRSRSIATLAQNGDMELMCIVIGAKSQYEEDGYTEKIHGGYSETSQLLDLGFNGYRTAQILYNEQVLQQKSVLNGSCDVTLGAGSNAHCIVPDNIAISDLSFRYADEAGLTAPIEKGQKLSTLQVWYGSVCLAQTDVYAMNHVAIAGTEFQENEKADEGAGFFTVILYLLGGVLAFALIVFVVLAVMRTMKITKTKRQSRRNSRNRRRSR